MIVDWENYYNEELNNFYYALNAIPVRKIKENYIGGNRSGIGVIINVCDMLLEKRARKVTLRRTRRQLGVQN